MITFAIIMPHVYRLTALLIKIDIHSIILLQTGWNNLHILDWPVSLFFHSSAEQTCNYVILR
jgi:hypothetical protein